MFSTLTQLRAIYIGVQPASMTDVDVADSRSTSNAHTSVRDIRSPLDQGCQPRRTPPIARRLPVPPHFFRPEAALRTVHGLNNVFGAHVGTVFTVQNGHALSLSPNRKAENRRLPRGPGAQPPEFRVRISIAALSCSRGDAWPLRATMAAQRHGI